MLFKNDQRLAEFCQSGEISKILATLLMLIQPSCFVGPDIHSTCHFANVIRKLTFKTTIIRKLQSPQVANEARLGMF